MIDLGLLIGAGARQLVYRGWDGQSVGAVDAESFAATEGILRVAKRAL